MLMIDRKPVGSLRLVITLCLTALCFAAAGMRPAAGGQPHLTETTGTITGFDEDQSLLNVNTRLGPKLFLVTEQTVILLNNHDGDTDDLVPPREVEVHYRFDTSEAFLVHVFSQATRSGTVVEADDNSLDLRVKTAVLGLDIDDQSLLHIGDILLEDPAVLAGLRAKAVFEPGSDLLLRLNAESQAFSGNITALDTMARTMTVTGKKARSFEVDAAATVLIGNDFDDLDGLTVGDKVRVAFVKRGGTLQALAIKAP
jgi:hypothetical protein